MANEASVRINLRVLKRSGGEELINDRYSVGYRVDVDGTAGPTPGSVAVPEVGVNVDLSELTTPGLCYLHNQGEFLLLWGVMDPESARFYPLGKIQPGHGVFLGQLYDFIGDFEIEATGTGSFVSPFYLHLKAVGGAGRAMVGVYEA